MKDIDQLDKLEKKIRYRNNNNNSIDNLKVDIDNIEEILKNAKKINLKRSIIKNVKITGKVFKVLLPFILIPTATFSFAKAINVTPIKIDTTKICQNLKREYDNRNNETLEYTDEKYTEADNQLLYTGKWTKDDEYYTRENNTYIITLDKVGLVKGLFDNDQDMLLEYLGEPTNKQIVMKKNVTPEELEEEPYIKVTTYEPDETYCTIKKESNASNAIFTFLYFLNTGALTYLTALMFDEPRFTLRSDIYDIKADYIPVNEEALRKKLAIKKVIYESITGNKHDKTK